VKAPERALSKGKVGRSALRSRAEKGKKLAKAIFFRRQHQMKTRKGGHEDKIGRTGFQRQGNAD